MKDAKLRDKGRENVGYFKTGPVKRAARRGKHAPLAITNAALSKGLCTFAPLRDRRRGAADREEQGKEKLKTGPASSREMSRKRPPRAATGGLVYAAKGALLAAAPPKECGA